jgi:myo-inositol 2-dehydrogenase/D-chiro-inositol 1-dehydrogenase
MVGSGFMARKHCSVLKTDARAVLKCLVASENSKAADTFKMEFGFNSLYRNLEEALQNEEIDIVYIISPNALHEKQVNISLQSGKHVFCEKPLAYTKKEFDSIEKNLSKSGKVLQIGMNCRYREQFSIPKQMAANGTLGDIRYIKGNYIFNLVDAINDKPWWTDYPEGIYPFLHAGAIHSLDLLRWLGGKINKVFAAGSGFELKKAWGKDNFVSVFEFDENIIGEFTGSASANGPGDFSIEIWGSKGCIIGTKYYSYSEGKLNNTDIEIKQPRIDLLLQFDDLINSIENNRQPMNSFAEAKQNLEFITAIEDSVKSGKTINIS